MLRPEQVTQKYLQLDYHQLIRGQCRYRTSSARLDPKLGSKLLEATAGLPRRVAQKPFLSVDRK
jgi:hypothetical protein